MSERRPSPSVANVPLQRPAACGKYVRVALHFLGCERDSFRGGALSRKHHPSRELPAVWAFGTIAEQEPALQGMVPAIPLRLGRTETAAGCEWRRILLLVRHLMTRLLVSLEDVRVVARAALTCCCLPTCRIPRSAREYVSQPASITRRRGNQPGP